MHKYFRSIVIVMTKGKNNKMKTTKIYVSLLPPLPSQDGGLLQTPQPPTFFTGKIFEKFFIDTWVSGQGWVNWLYGNLSKNAKMVRGKIRKGGGGVAAVPFLRERVKHWKTDFEKTQHLFFLFWRISCKWVCCMGCVQLHEVSSLGPSSEQTVIISAGFPNTVFQRFRAYKQFIEWLCKSFLHRNSHFHLAPTSTLSIGQSLTDLVSTDQMQ